MNPKCKDFVPIDGASRAPIHSLDRLFTYDDVKDMPDVAVLVQEPYVVFDIDDNEQFDVLYEIIKNENINCKVMKTNHGGHFWFKSIEVLPNWQNANTPITIKSDVKSWGKRSTVTVKKNGEWRQWLKDDENVDEVPFWLIPHKLKKDLFNFKEGDGRDPQLFSYIIPLISLKYNRDQIYKIFTLINKYIFEQPLKTEEIDKMFDGNDIFEKKKYQFFEGRTFLHNVFVDWLRESYFFKSYGGQVYLYDKGIYTTNEDEINRKMIEQIPNLTVRQMKEAYENLRLKTTVGNETIDPFVINVKNGLFDLKSNKMIDHSPYIFTLNQLNCTYNAECYDKSVDNMINSVTENNPKLRQIIIELLGYLLIGDCRYQKAFILLGQGANGKSKFLEMVMNFIGYNNCSSLALENLSDQFKVANLVGKVANIGDDSGGDLLKNTAIFKKIVTGDSITVERKYGQPFEFNNCSKMLFSANNLPPSSDKSEGFFRRIIIIPFNATFKPGNPNYDPNISDKLSTENARSYLLNLAIEGALTIIKNKSITIPAEVIDACKSYEIANNNVLQWFEGVNPEIINRTPQEVYTDYCLYCNTSNSHPVQISKFNIELKNKYPSYEIQHIGTTYLWIKKEI